ncbi:unnamed protein product [Musa banksii]
MTLHANYLRGTMVAVLSILQHTSCSENVTFHFLAAWFKPDVLASIRTAFPYLDFRMYRFDSHRVRSRISMSSAKPWTSRSTTRASTWLTSSHPRSAESSTNIIVVELEGHVVAASEYHHANFTNYFTDAFWSDATLSSTFDGRQQCYTSTPG